MKDAHSAHKKEKVTDFEQEKEGRNVQTQPHIT